MHRLHPNDLCGVIDELGLPYVKLVLPMEYVRSITVKTPWFEDPRREEGEILVSPERLPREKLEQIKVELGSYGYDTQYQQQPRSREGTQFFSTSQFLVDGQPVEMPRSCDGVFAVIDSATKTGSDHDGTAVVYAALTNHPEPRLVIVDWDIVQIEGSLLETWLPQVFTRVERLARETRARAGSPGVWIEDKASGMVLLQQALRRGWRAHAIEGKLTLVGKSERAISVSGYVNKGWVKIARHAYDKVAIYKGRSRNHLLYQLTGFRIGVQDKDDDLFDAAIYAIALGLGGPDGF
jgi:hypothetical protein